MKAERDQELLPPVEKPKGFVIGRLRDLQERVDEYYMEKIEQAPEKPRLWQFLEERALTTIGQDENERRPLPQGFL